MLLRVVTNHSSSSTKSHPPPSHSPSSFTLSGRIKTQPKLSPPDLMYLSGLTSGPLLQISLLQNVPCVLNRPRCGFLQSCREQSKALGFPVHTVPLHRATHMHMKSKGRGTDPSGDLSPSCEASLQRHHTTYVSPENCVPPTQRHFEGVLGPMLQPSPMRGQAPSCRRQNRAQQHARPDANSPSSLRGSLLQPARLSCTLPRPPKPLRRHHPAQPHELFPVLAAGSRSSPQGNLTLLTATQTRPQRAVAAPGAAAKPWPPRQGSLGRWGPLAAGSAQVHGPVVPLAKTCPNSAHGGSLPLAVPCIALAAARPRRRRGREAPEPWPAAVVSPFSAAHLLSS